MGLQKNGDLVINWNELKNGQSDSPFLGIGAQRNIDTTNLPGVARLQNALVKSYNTSGLPIAIVQDTYGSTYVGTNAGNFYVNGVLNQTGLGIIRDMRIYFGYLFISQDTTVSVYGPLNPTQGGAKFFGSWLANGTTPASLQPGYNHPIIAGRDNILYVGNGNYVAAISNLMAGTTLTSGAGSIAVSAGLPIVTGSGTSFLSNFSVGSVIVANGETHTVTLVVNNTTLYTDNWVANFSGSYQFSTSTGAAPTVTFNPQALQLPNNVFVRCMCEYATYLAIGSQSGSSYTDFGYGVGNIYYWDRTSPSFDGQPQEFKESGIHQIMQVGPTLYVNAGVNGNVYQTNRSSFTLIKTLPFNYAKLATTTPFTNAMVKVGNEMLIGSSTGTDSFLTANPSYHGVYTIDLNSLQQGIQSVGYLRNVISTGNSGGTQPLYIGAILAPNNGSGGVYKYFLVGWQDGSTCGVDIISSNLYATGVFESQIYEVGTPTERGTFNQLQYTLGQPMITGNSLIVNYRKSLTDTWKLVGTFNAANASPGLVDHTTAANMADLGLVQLQVIIGSNGGAFNNTLFKELRLTK